MKQKLLNILKMIYKKKRQRKIQRKILHFFKGSVEKQRKSFFFPRKSIIVRLFNNGYKVGRHVTKATDGNKQINKQINQ